MKIKISASIVPLVLLAVLRLGNPQAPAQSAAIGYQGVLMDEGRPANGPYSMQFKLFDTAAMATGIQQGRTIEESVPVANGAFSANLDFGVAVFDGAPRFLEISVKRQGGLLSPLGPRQQLASVPYAIKSLNAATASTALTVANGSAVKSLNDLKDSVTLAAGPNVTITPSGNTLTIAATGGGGGNLWGLNGADAYFTTGNVGIGTTAPTPGIRLEVLGATLFRPANGSIQFGTPNAELGLSIIPTAGDNRADLRFNGSVLKLVASAGRTPPSEANGIAISTTGNVGMGTGNPAFKLDVRSATSTAIVGRSSFAGGAGVYGESDQFNGVRGVAHNANHGGVVGVHDGGGIAVYGTGATGIQGDSSSVFGFGGYFRNTAGGIALGVQGTARVSVLQITGGADVAEPFKMSHDAIAKGSVVIIDDENPGQLKLSDKSYDTRVAGIVSGANGVNPGISLQQEGVLEGGQNVALSGRVHVLADAKNGSIKPGDLLTTSDNPGHAMRVADPSRAQGAILGKAMSGLKEGQGFVLVLVTLQ